MAAVFTVYGMSDSGNCYKVRLALAQLALPYRWVEVDTTKGETRSAAFLARNPNGKVPTLELADGTCLPESNAILDYLAHGTPLLPEGRLERARVLQWMFFEQYSHEPSEPFFAGGGYAIADIALYASTHCAGDGGFDLGRYPAVRAWLVRVEPQRRFVRLLS